MPNDVLTRHGMHDRPNRFDLPPKPPAETSGSVYDMRPYRPMWQLVVRGALWSALAIGCLGGIVALAGLGKEPVEQVVSQEGLGGDDPLLVPVPVGGTAERAVGMWLTATEDDRQALDELFIEPAVLAPNSPRDSVQIVGLTTLTGHQVQPGYWVVTVQADVLETFDGEVKEPASWFIEVGVVGDPSSGLSVLATPAFMPGPKTGLTGYASTKPPLRQPDSDDMVAQTVEGFLGALLAGKGDPSRYLAEGVVMTTADPVPFADVTVESIATEPQEDGSTHVWVEALATTVAGRAQPVGYELFVTPRDDDRWEIQTLWGAPSLDEVPVDEEEAPAEEEVPAEGE
jgi:hypothetical protein